MTHPHQPKLNPGSEQHNATETQHHNVDPLKNEATKPMKMGWTCPLCYTTWSMQTSQPCISCYPNGFKATKPQPDTSKQGWRERFDTVASTYECLVDGDQSEYSQARQYLKAFISAQCQQAAEEVLTLLGSVMDLFFEWREYVKKQYDNSKNETLVIDGFPFWLDKRIEKIRDKIKNV